MTVVYRHGRREMTIKTISELNEEYGRRTAEIVSGYRDELAALRDVKLEEGMYLDELDDAQRMRLLRNERERKAAELYSRARAEYVDAAERYRERVEARRGGLQAVLFGTLEGA